MGRDRNLLFGILALQLKQVSSDALMVAARMWTEDPSRDLKDYLVKTQALTLDACCFVEEVVKRVIESQGGNTTLALEAFGGEDQVYLTYQGTLSFTPSCEVKTVPILHADRPDVLKVSDVRGVREAPGRYTTISEYGRGGMGRVLLAYDQHLGRDIALKELLPQPGSGTTDHRLSPVRLSVPYMARFLQEARITGQLEHPSIVPVYELGYRRDDSLYYTMKLVRGKNLSQALKELSGLRERLNLMPHFVDLCQAIAYAHSRGVIHRDLKPSNVMIGEFGETVVIDWGLAKARGKEDIRGDEMAETLNSVRLGHESDRIKTAYGLAMGTPAYMAPEQVKGELENVDERSDVYSLGAVLYEVITGKPPFVGTSVHEVLNMVLTTEPQPVNALEPDSSPELIAICRRAMERDRSRRYRSAKELADDVQRYLSGALVEVYHYGIGEYLKRYIAKHRAAVGSALAVSLLIVGLTVYFNYRLYESRERESLQRSAAENARDREEAARKDAEAAALDAQRSSYAVSVSLADEYLKDNKSSWANEILWSAPEHMRDWEWGYLLLKGNNRFLWELESDGVASNLVWSPEGGRLIRVCDRTVQTLDAQSGEVVSEFNLDLPDVPEHVSIHADGKLIVTAHAGESRAKVTRIWDLNSGRLLQTIEQNPWVPEPLIAPNGEYVLIFSSSEEPAIDIQPLPSGSIRRLHTICPRADIDAWHVDEYTWRGAAISPDGQKVLTMPRDRAASMWNATTGEEVWNLDLGPLRAARFSPDGQYILVDFEHNQKRDSSLIEATTGGELLRLAQGVSVKDSRFSPDSRTLLAVVREVREASWEVVTKMLDLANDKVLYELVSISTTTPAFSPDGKHFASPLNDGGFGIFESGSGRQLYRLDDSEDRSRTGNGAFSPDGSVLLFTRDSYTSAWDLGPLISDEMNLPLLASHPEQVVTPNGSLILGSRRNQAGSSEYVVDVRNTEDGELVFSTGPGHWVHAALSPSGELLVVSNENGSIELFDIIRRSHVRTLEGHVGPANLTFNASSDMIVSASKDGTARIWDVLSGVQQSILTGHECEVVWATFSLDSSRVLTLSMDGSAKLWDVTDDSELFTMRCQEDQSPFDSSCKDAGDSTWETLQYFFRVAHLARFSPDGEKIVVAAFHKDVTVWEIATGELLCTLSGHNGYVLDVAFDPQGSCLITASTDGTARVWDMMSGACLQVLQGHNNWVSSATFNPSGTRILTTVMWSEAAAKVWESQTGNELLTLSRGLGDGFIWGAFTDDGKKIIAGNEDSLTVYAAAPAWPGTISPGDSADWSKRLELWMRRRPPQPTPFMDKLDEIFGPMAY